MLNNGIKTHLRCLILIVEAFMNTLDPDQFECLLFFPYSLKSVIGMAVGAGANILARFAVSFIHFTSQLHFEWS